MADLSLLVREKLSNKEIEVEIPDTKLVGELAEALRKELEMPEKDTRGNLVYKLVLTRTGVMLAPRQNLREAGVVDQDVLSFWGEPTAAATPARLKQEYRRILERFADRPHVKIEAFGNPPTQYKVTFTHKGLIGRNGSNLIFGNHHVLHIVISAEFPNTKPTLRMETPTYHPNIQDLPEGNVCVGSQFYSGESIADLIAKVGNYLQYKEFDLESVHRGDIRRWIEEQNRNVGPFGEAGFGG